MLRKYGYIVFLRFIILSMAPKRKAPSQRQRAAPSSKKSAPTSVPARESVVPAVHAGTKKSTAAPSRSKRRPASSPRQPPSPNPSPDSGSSRQEPLDMSWLISEVTKGVLANIRPHLVSHDQTHEGANGDTVDISSQAAANLTAEITGGFSCPAPAGCSTAPPPNGLSLLPLSVASIEAPSGTAARAECHGGPPATYSWAPVTTFAPANSSLPTGFPLGAAISPTIRGKILADEYINLGSLISPNQPEEFALSVAQNSLQVRQVQKNRGILNIDQWSQAFTLYSSIYLEKYPDQTQKLLKYSYNIRDMANSYKGFAWRAYDEEFRLCRVTTGWPWDVINYELFMRSVTVAANMAVGQNQQSPTHYWQHQYPPTSSWRQQQQRRGQFRPPRFEGRGPFRQPFRGQEEQRTASDQQPFPRYHNPHPRTQATGPAPRLQ